MTDAVGRLHALHLLAQPQGDAVVAQVVAQRLDDLLVRELQQPRPLLDQDDADAERREHAGVLDADDAAADHDQRLGQLGQLHQLIAEQDRASVDGHVRRLGRPRAGRDDERVGPAGRLAVGVHDLDRVRVHEAGRRR